MSNFKVRANGRGILGLGQKFQCKVPSAACIHKNVSVECILIIYNSLNFACAAMLDKGCEELPEPAFNDAAEDMGSEKKVQGQKDSDFA